jgi:hypothetical protein
MNRPLTKKEANASITEMWESAIESTYRDLIEKAVLAERDACAKLCEELDKADDTVYRELSDGGVCAEAIRARK